MKEKMKDNRVSQILVALLAVVLGVLCIASPSAAANIMVRIIGIVILIVGIVMIVTKLGDETLRIPAIILGAIIAAIGIFIFTHPGQTISLIFIVFGVLMIADAISEITASMAIKAATGAWLPSFILAMISLIFGIICVLAPHFIPDLSFVVIGIMLVYDGVTSIYSAIKANRAEKGVVDSHIVDEKDI
ncbi:MAG: DUF308 domain-containing protein [Lachnospiraceae bacterium]|nr:DUF308 domain-containing protein [Lachnospiraceae bacterium]